MYYEHQVQRSAYYSGPLERCTDEEARALGEEFLSYTDALSASEYPLPPAGLPGLLHKEYSRDEPAADLIEIGLAYARSIICNERKSMHNRWKDARAFIRKIEERTEERVRNVQAETWTRQEMRRVATAPRQLVYFIGSASGPVKIGMAVNPQNRLRGLQTGHHEKLELLATCAGGQEQERAFHRRFEAHRLNGEWFERTPEIEAEIARLQR